MGVGKEEEEEEEEDYEPEVSKQIKLSDEESESYQE